MIDSKEKHDFYNTFNRFYNIVEYFRVSIKKNESVSEETVQDMDQVIEDLSRQWTQIKKGLDKSYE